MSFLDQTCTDGAGYHWAPTPHLKFVKGVLHQWWEGRKPIAYYDGTCDYGRMAHPDPSVTTNYIGEWRQVLSE